VIKSASIDKSAKSICSVQIKFFIGTTVDYIGLADLDWAEFIVVPWVHRWTNDVHVQTGGG
jgi:hypothetical protein